ncbi:alpha/beta hydrolase-fold protein [Achromobacter sp. F4_2707]|uniref:alpha/beta hydrolase n=1 Tax=Achromobacter sp. F4_2707 TaxID=3114286 RepID=UPI0039C63B99
MLHSPNHTRALEVVGKTVADRPSPHYRFETHTLNSSDGERRYRVVVGFPKVTDDSGKGIQNHSGAILYMLDGNAAIDTLTDTDLAALSDKNAPILVAIGYDVPTRNDVVSRAYDYTPPVYEGSTRVLAPIVRGRVGGGADTFLQFIEQHVKPLVSMQERDGVRDYLWGHSYGGLFALHVLFTQPDAFDAYIVADPSVWWHNGELLREWEAFDTALAANKRIDILIGTKPRPTDRPPAPDAGMIQRDGWHMTPGEALEKIVKELETSGAQVSYQTFPQHGHGEMIRVSLEHALHIASHP